MKNNALKISTTILFYTIMCNNFTNKLINSYLIKDRSRVSRLYFECQPIHFISPDMKCSSVIF